jgi:addiction module HigA family antidote
VNQIFGSDSLGLYSPLAIANIRSRISSCEAIPTLKIFILPRSLKLSSALAQFIQAQTKSKLSTITERQIHMTTNKMRPIHPGEILREEFLVLLGLSANALSMALDISALQIHDIVREQTALTSDIASRLASYFNTTAQFWINLQNSFDLKRVE